MAQKRTLTVVADDLGLSAPRDEGIFRAFAAGAAIQHASLLVNGPTANEAVERAKSVALPMGLHVNLTEFVCCCT